MKFLFLAAAALLAFPLTVSAQDAPSGQPGATAPVVPPSTPPAMPPAATADAARKEEEETRAWSLSRLTSYLKSKGSLSDSLAARDREIADLRARLKAFEDGSALKALQDENARMRADLEGMAEYAQTHGLLNESGAPAAHVPQSPMGKVAGQAVAAAVSTQLAALGVNADKLPAARSGQSAGDDSMLQELVDQIAAEKDPARKGALVQKARRLREQLAAVSKN